MNNGTMIFYESFSESIRELPPEAQVTVYNAIWDYQFKGQEPELSGIPKAIWTLIKPQIDANNRRRDNGAKGGAPKGNNNATKTSEVDYVDNQKQPTDNQKQPTDNQKQANVNDNVNVNVNDKDIKDYEPIAKTCARIVEAWNADHYVQRVQAMTDKRKAALKARLSTYGEDKLLEAIKRVSLSSFCHGSNDRGWQANIDWFLRPDTVEKLLEGTYDDLKGKPPEKQNGFQKGVMKSDYGDLGELEKRLLGG